MSYRVISISVDSSHIDFYNQIDPNTSQAVRRLTDILLSHSDSLKNIDKNPVVALDIILKKYTEWDIKKYKKIVDKSLIFINFGLLFYLISLIVEGVNSFISTILSSLLLSYGIAPVLYLFFRKIKR